MPALHHTLSLFLLSFLLTGQVVAAAEQAPITIDTGRLQNLFQTLSEKPGDSYLQARIEEERARIRAAINQELTSTIATIEKGKEGPDPASALSRQERILAFLEEHRREATVDSDLLQTEEQNFYLQPGVETSNEEYRLTESHSDLLAKHAVVEERMNAIESLLPLHKERLQKFRTEQWFQRFSLLIRIVTLGGILLGFLLLERFLRMLLVRRFRQPNQRYLFTKIFPSTVYAILAIWILSLVFARYSGALTSLGIVGAGLAVALQDIVKDVVGWFVILYRRPFTLGHRITIGPYAGDVIDISVLRTTLLEVSSPSGTATTSPLDSLERTGKTLYVPNSLLLTQPVLNYHTTSDYLKAEMQITITYESDWRKAEGVLQRILEEATAPYTEEARQQHQRRMWIYHEAKEPTGPVIYMEAGASGITFTLRFMIPIGARRTVTTTLTRRILEEFGKTGVAIAYNTLRVIPTPDTLSPRERAG